MPTPNAHARLSASASKRWLNCTASPNFESQFPDSPPGVFAEEGTLAHEVCEAYGRCVAGQTTTQERDARVEELKTHELWNKEMLTTAKVYADYIYAVMLRYETKPYATFEVRVDLTDYVPDGFGTCDCCVIGGDTVHIIDYKHGKGVAVSSINNSQMRLYALGALRYFRAIYGDQIQRVVTSIVQPRISEEVNEESLTVSDLLAWGEEVKKTAQIAFTGNGAEFHAGEWCRFCKGKAQCRARAKGYTALEEFNAMQPNLLSDEEIADILTRGREISKWLGDVEEYALQAIMDGKKLPGFRVVEGRSQRKFTDADAAMQALEEAGVPKALMYDYKPKSLAQLEKAVDKETWNAHATKYITKPMGSPTLVSADDKRPDYNTALLEAVAMND